MMTQEKIYVESRQVKCEGEAEIVGHPLVYLDMGDKDEIQCPYCSRLFVCKH